MSAIKTFSFIQPSGYRADCCKSTAAAKYYLQLFVIARLIKFQESKATISLKPKNDQCVCLINREKRFQIRLLSNVV